MKKIDVILVVSIIVLCLMLFWFVKTVNAQTFQKQQNETYQIQWLNAYEKDGELFPYEEGIEFIVHEYTQDGETSIRVSDTLSTPYICVRDAAHAVQAVDWNNNKSVNSDTVFVEMTGEIIPPEEEDIPVQFRVFAMLDWTGNLQQPDGIGTLERLNFISKGFSVSGGVYKVETYFVGEIDLAFGSESYRLFNDNRFEPVVQEYNLQAGERLLHILAIDRTQFRYGEDDWILRITKVEPEVELYPPASIWVQ